MIQNKKTNSQGLIGFTGWLFIRVIVTFILGCFASVMGLIFIFLILGKARGLDWLDLLQSNSQGFGYAVHPHFLSFAIQTFNNLVNQADKIELISNKSSVTTLTEQIKRSINMEGVFYLKIVLLSLKLSMIRLGLLCHWGLLFLGLWLVGLVDGFTQRSIRRSQVGRESALTYHRAKRTMEFSLLLGLFLIIAFPLTIQVLQWIVIFFAIWFGASVFVATKSFKKYI